MRIKTNKLYILILTALIVFQDSITELFNVSFFDYFDEFLILFFALRAFFKLLKNGHANKNVRYIIILMAAFWIIGIVGCLIHSRYTTSSLLMASILMIKIYILIVSLIIYPLKEKTFGYFIDSLLILGKISAVAGLINFFLPTLWVRLIPYAYEYTRLGLSSAMGLFVHAGQYGWFMLMVGIIYYSRFRTYHKKSNLYKFIIYAILACLSLKVKVIIGVAAILVFDAYIMNKKKIDIKKILIPVVAIIPIVFIFWNLLTDTYTQYFTASGGSARYAFLTGGLSIIKDFFPLGVGFGKFGTYYAQINYSEWYYTYGLNTVWGLAPGNVFFGMDTFWPAIMGETGVLGLVVYVLLLLTIYKELKIRNKMVAGSNNLFQRNIALMALLIFVQAVVESFGEQIFCASPQNIVIGLMVGFSLSMQASKRVNYQ